MKTEMTHTSDPWPLPWRNETEIGCFGSIIAANGEAVAQVQPLAPSFEDNIRKRNEWRNVQAKRICDAVNIGINNPADTLRKVREALDWSLVDAKNHGNISLETELLEALRLLSPP